MCIVGHITIIDFAIMIGSSRWFLTVLYSPMVRPKVKNRHKYWYSATQTTLSLIVFVGKGQEQLINKLNFTVAITFFSVMFFHMIKCTYAFAAIYIERFLTYRNCNDVISGCIVNEILPRKIIYVLICFNFISNIHVW